MNYTEEATLFECASDMLLGILTKPVTPAKTGIIVVVGGPQYRVGSHRQFVLLSRALAEAGYAVLRFDYRGMGDSEGETRDFLAVNEDIAAAINLMYQRISSLQHVALWGLCDGASAALLYCFAARDLRVNGLCLLNPWVRSEASLARTQVKHYYMQRLMQKTFWIKLFQGDVTWHALTNLMRKIYRILISLRSTSGAVYENSQSKRSEPAFQQKMAAGWNEFSGPIFLLLSGNDFTAKEFSDCMHRDPEWQQASRHRNLTRHDLPGADHTFSSTASRDCVTELTLRWLDEALHIEAVHNNSCDNCIKWKKGDLVLTAASSATADKVTV